MNISFLGEVVEIQEDGKLVVRDLTGAEMYEKEEDGS